MICTSFLWCIFFFATLSVSRGYEDPFIIPVCESQGPDDVYLDNSNADLTKISKSPVRDSSIKCLNFKGNTINDIDEDAFNNFSELYYLNLAENPINIKNFIRTAIPNLETLILDGPFSGSYYGHYDAYNEYRSDMDWLLFLPELRKLSLRYYKHYPNLIDLWLTILAIPALTHLDLSGSDLTIITNLAEMPNLTHINVNDNRMEYLSGSFLKNLEYLSMDRNNIVNVCGTSCKIHSMTPRGMPNLKYLSLGDNEIENIGTDAFVDSKNLLFLNLAGNKIQDFQQHAFDNMTKLKNLTLDKNNLRSIPDIYALQELEVLSLNANNIEYIDEMTFRNMPKLKIVSLRKNKVTSVYSNVFVNLPTLTVLDFSSNKIEFLRTNWMWPNNSLKVLHLDDNELLNISSISLESLEALEILSIVHNPIKEISTIDIPKNVTIKLSPD